MADEDKFKGTDDEIGRIDVLGLATIVVTDDGYTDNDMVVEYENRSLSTSGISQMLWDYREEHGDAALEDLLANGESGDNVGASSFDRAPPVFSCDDCHRSFPRSSNQTPDRDEDICPDCADN